MNPDVQRRLLSDLNQYTEITTRLAHDGWLSASNQPLDPAQSAIAFGEHLERARRHKFMHSGLDILDSARAKDVLSVGCGLCAKEIVLLSRNQRLNMYGVDVAHHSLRTAQVEAQRRSLPLRLCTGDVVRLPYQDEAFDAVISAALMEHVYDIKQFHDEIYRVLKPGGLYFGGASNYWGVLGLTNEGQPDPASPEKDSILRRVRALFQILPKLGRGLQGEYTQRIPFDEFTYGVDHKFVRGFKHHIDSSDLHGVNPFEIGRLLPLSNFEKVKVWSYFNRRSILGRIATFIFALPVIRIFGGSVIVLAVKPKSTDTVGVSNG